MSESGRYFVTDFKSGRKFVVEPIGDNHTVWGDIDPASKKIQGDYGEKHRGSVDFEESIVTKENGFRNIKDIKPGESPTDYINQLLKQSV